MQDPEGLSDKELIFGLQIIKNESDRLMILVEDLLDFSRYESKRMVLDLSSFDFHKLVEEITFQLKSKAYEHRVTISTVCESGLGISHLHDV